MLNIEEIRNKIKNIGAIIGAPDVLLYVRVVPVGDGTPYIEIRESEYHYVISERGCEFSREIFLDDDDILYKITSKIVTRMALDYELQNRIDSQDFRRIYFSKEIELMDQICPEWGAKKKAEIKETLRNSPYSDEEKKHQSLLGKIKNKLFSN